MNLMCVILTLNILYVARDNSATSDNDTTATICPVHKKGPSLNVVDLIGSWMTVYAQPMPIDCFKFHVRATTELEREQNQMKYGNFNNRVKWSSCYLQVETSSFKHFLQGNGSESGLMQNVIIFEDKPGEYKLRHDSADQWLVFGRRGSEVLVIRDCYGETAAAFARAPYWPTMTELSAIFHRSGITTQTYKRSICLPETSMTKQFETTNFSRTANVLGCVKTGGCPTANFI